MSLAVSPSAGKPYGLARVCRIWRLARSTVYFQRRCSTRTNGSRRGPVGPCPDGQLIEHIRSVLTDSPFHGEGYRKVWARLRFKGTRSSPRRVLRLMQEHDLLAPRRVKHPVGRKAHDGKIITEEVNRIWGIDQTSCLTTDEGQVAIFFAVDHCSMECVGIHAAKCGTRFEALEPIRQGVRECFGEFGKDIANGLSLRHDHGSQFVSGFFRRNLLSLGSNRLRLLSMSLKVNGCAERFVRILKENLLWLRPFRDAEQLRQALLEFKRTYNQSWILQRHGYKTPAQIRREQIGPLLKVA